MNRGHWILAAVLGLLIVGLIANNYAVTAQHRRYSEAYARTETAGNNMFYTVSETLTYVSEFQRYLLGAASRRDVQLKRALLGQRLAVVGENGQTAGDSASPEYRAKLSELDDALQQVPPGILPIDQRDNWQRIVLPRAEALLESSRQLADSKTADLHTDARIASTNLLNGRLIQLALLIAALAVGAVLLVWVAADVARQYRGARAALDRERKALHSTESQLARVSRLDRGQADVLERIATGQPLPAVLRDIVELTLGVSGQHAARITTRHLAVMLPPDADVSAAPVWRRTFGSGKVDDAGTLEVFGGPTVLDDMDLTALLRCRDLASLALEQEDARDAALVLAEAKSSYVMMVSHEIRTPLHGILGFSELLESELFAEGRNKAATWSSQIRVEAERLTRLIEDLLNLSRLDAGKLQVVAKPFQLRRMLDNLMQTATITAAAKGLQLNTSVDPAISDWRTGDPDRLHQVLLNLVTNATKFTHEGRIDVEITLAATDTDPDLVRFAVTDTGPGIPSEEIDRILEPFAQVSDSDSERGSGLGLAISNGIVNALGGNGIGVVSIEGRGSTFHFTLPLPESAPQEPAPRPAAAEPTEVTAMKTILVVDDNPTNQLLIEAQLKKLGYRYEAAFDGAEAVQRVAVQRFDAVLMDCSMPVMDGYVATRRIRAAERGTAIHTPVLALTASSTEANRDACERAGMDGFLTKPLHLADLAQELGGLLGADEADRLNRELTSGNARPTAPEMPFFDDEWIDQLLAELGADPLQKVAHAFVAELPQRMADLRAVAATGDADAIRRSVHAMRSPAKTLGAIALARRLEELEESKSPVADVSRAALDDLEELIDNTVDRLHKRLGHIVDQRDVP